MPEYFDSISESIQSWILQQPLFFVASAPTHGKHINVSPKGHPNRSLRILSPNLVAYLDSTGSGCETISHIYENRRVTLMMNSFGPSPRILRLFCTGEVAEKGTKAFEKHLPLFNPAEEDCGEEGKEQVDKSDVEAVKPDWRSDAIRYGSRAIILLHVFKVQTSCGYGVPKISPSSTAGTKTTQDLATYSSWTDRDTLLDWAGKKKDRDIREYRVKNNVRSLDGLPGLKAARRDCREWIGVAEIGGWFRRVFVLEGGSVLIGMILMFVLLVGAKRGFDVEVLSRNVS